MLNLNEFARQVHENAKKHGFWESKITGGELVAWLHSELSESYEEHRLNHPMVWYSCTDANGEGVAITATSEGEPKVSLSVSATQSGADGKARQEYCGKNGICTTKFSCAYRNPKPEGIAVELIDVCLLILDYVGAVGIHMENCSSIRSMIDLLSDECRRSIQSMNFPDFIAQMHMEVSAAYQMNSPEGFVHALLPTQGMIFYWIEAEGLDPEAILLEKFHYNENRPYKHGR